MQAQQICTNPGQTPITAYPICGTEPFTMNTVTYCGSTAVPVSCPGGFNYINTNPTYFRMACYSSGTLGFTIIPDEITANYDWQLFDITNRNPYSIFTDASLFVACNWSAATGETGASADGTNTLICYGTSEPTYSKMPDLLQGHTYLLMVCNQSASGGIFELTLTEGTAVVTDAVDPRLDNARANCDGTKIVLRTNKKIACNSIAADGSDFQLSNGITAISAVPFDCTSTAGTDSILITLAQPLPNGTYTLLIRSGTDGNTIGDICNKFIDHSTAINFSVTDFGLTSINEINVEDCKPSRLTLIFNNPIQCASIVSDGSNFRINGPQSIVITSASGYQCNPDNLSYAVTITLGSPVIIGGNYQLALTTGSNGANILDECGRTILTGVAYPLPIASAVSADFTFSTASSCNSNLFSFQHAGLNAVTSWQWNFGTSQISTEQNPVHYFQSTGSQTVSLIVSNGQCVDTLSKIIQTGKKLNASFILQENICPGEQLDIINTSTGDINQWYWDFGNGITSTLRNPMDIRFQNPPFETQASITLIVKNNQLNCSDTAQQITRLLTNCLIEVPSAFTPNGDGLNDYLFPLNAMNTTGLHFQVFNRFGQLVFQSKDGNKKWDGRINGILQDTGVFAWILRYTHKQTGEKIVRKGTTLLFKK